MKETKQNKEQDISSELFENVKKAFGYESEEW